MAGELLLEPVVTKEELLALLAVGTELQQLDFKEKVDFDDHAEVVELTKDIAALQSCGGYLVIGVDDQGQHIAIYVSVEKGLSSARTTAVRFERALSTAAHG
ncbi:MAG: ATP-binding protein [Candidatus Nanopelagicales bacterium]